MSVSFITNRSNQFANPYRPVNSEKKATFAQRMQQEMSSKRAASDGENVSTWDAFQALIKQRTPSTPYGVNRIEDQPACYQIMKAYDKWAEQHPKTLPESKGWTEENAAWLRMKYTGKLSPYELMDAVDSLRRMKIISSNEEDAIYGNEPIIRPFKELMQTQLVPIEDAPKTFNGPLAYCNDLDDILQYFKKRRETEPIFEDWYLEGYYAGKFISSLEEEDLQPDDTEILEHFML